MTTKTERIQWTKKKKDGKASSIQSMVASSYFLVQNVAIKIRAIIIIITTTRTTKTTTTIII